MNYKRQYELLIEKAKNRTNLEGYKERHHIIPKCMGGIDDKENLVELTAREHYLAHWLLHKMYPENNKLVYALNSMIIIKKDKRKLKISSKEYELIKLKISVLQSKLMSGDNNPSKRSEVRKKTSESLKGRVRSKEHCENISKAKKGYIRTMESRKKQSESVKGEKNHFWKKKHKQSTKKKIGDKNRNRYIPRSCKVKSMKKIMVDGIIYRCISDYCEKFNFKPTCISYRLKSPNFPNYKYL